VAGMPYAAVRRVGADKPNVIRLVINRHNFRRRWKAARDRRGEARAVRADVEHAIGEGIELVGRDSISTDCRLRRQAGYRSPGRAGSSPVGGSVSGGRAFRRPNHAAAVGRDGDGIVITAGDAARLRATDGPGLAAVTGIGIAVFAVAV